jgi:DNA-binding IclR family transcriptional regulator
MGRGERILEILAECPCGLTAKELADHMGTSMGQISSPLSKLVAYGFLKRALSGSRSIYFSPSETIERFHLRRHDRAAVRPTR